MTTASPTPFNTSTFGSSRLPPRRPISRPLSSRAHHGAHSPLSSMGQFEGFSADAPALQNISVGGGDSSDDEIPQPMAFSALTRALLEDKNGTAPALATRTRPPSRNGLRQEAILPTRSVGTTPPSQGHLRITRRSPPAESAQRQSPHRIVNLSASHGPNSLRRTGSTINRTRGISNPAEEQGKELITPAPKSRVKSSLEMREDEDSPASGRAASRQSRSTTNGSSGARSAYHSHPSSQKQSELEMGNASSQEDQQQDRTRPDAAPSAMRAVKRVPMGSGTFLRGAPMRRGAKRRPSDDQQSPVDAVGDGHASQEEREFAPVTSRPVSRRASPQQIDEAHVSAGKPRWRQEEYQQQQNEQDSEPQQEHEYQRPASRPSSAMRRPSQVQPVPQQQPVFKVPPPLPHSQYDQENEPPPTFKRNKPQSGIMIASTLEKAAGIKPRTHSISAQTSPRPALAQLSSNTPARPAPPPPKMSLAETATAAGGASTVKAKKKRSHIVVNGKMFSVRGRLGRGGSSEVYKVMAENDKMFALKKVNLEDCNEETVRGFKGEIDLLKKLENVDRVVRLIDWEVNSQKQTLNVLMEMGETDFNHLLGHRLHSEEAKLDLSFTRHYWREMLECVDAVHAYDIVHSDLKPANFLLVQGRLKLIDFGIANAIDIENTVNVHRETNVGTPNYMSPESLQDTNGGERAPGSAKLMKLGKPSDVWSLGCILYQMTYGKPPFAYIPNQWNRIMAIINPSVSIQYPTNGIGDVYVPSSLRRLLQRCLNRDAKQRPTIASMLGDRDTFLNPDAEKDGAVPMTEELLGQILQRVVDRCRDTSRGIPTNEALKSYPKGFLDNIRASLER